MTDDSASKKTYKQLVDFGLDKHGFYGLIYSSDNGANYKLLVGTQGRIFYPEDARNFWPYLKDFVSEQLASAISLDWNNIKNKPDVALKSDLENLATKDEVKKVEKEPGPPGQTWQPYVGDDGNWHLKLIISGGEI